MEQFLETMYLRRESIFVVAAIMLFLGTNLIQNLIRKVSKVEFSETLYFTSLPLRTIGALWFLTFIFFESMLRPRTIPFVLGITLIVTLLIADVTTYIRARKGEKVTEYLHPLIILVTFAGIIFAVVAGGYGYSKALFFSIALLIVNMLLLSTIMLSTAIKQVKEQGSPEQLELFYREISFIGIEQIFLIYIVRNIIPVSF